MEHIKNNQEEHTPTQTVYGIFNKHNGILFAFEPDKSQAESYNKDHFLVREVILRPNEYFFGDYYTGQVYSNEVKPLIYEEELLENHWQCVLKEYSVFDALIIIANVIEANESIFKPELFKKFITFCKAKQLKYEHTLKAIKENKESYNFISKEDIKNVAVKRLEGII